MKKTEDNISDVQLAFNYGIFANHSNCTLKYYTEKKNSLTSVSEKTNTSGFKFTGIASNRLVSNRLTSKGDTPLALGKILDEGIPKEDV